MVQTVLCINPKAPTPIYKFSGLILHCLIKVVERICLKIKAFSEGFHFIHPRRPRGSQSGREKRRDEIFQARAEEPLGTDSHRIISERSSERRLLIGHKKCFVLLCPIGEQRLLSSFRELVHACYSWVSEDAFHQKKKKIDVDQSTKTIKQYFSGWRLFLIIYDVNFNSIYFRNIFATLGLF